MKTNERHSQNYRPDIDGLRAIAVLAVIIFHAFPQTLKGGFIGVDIFFVISGFLITNILKNHLADGTFSFKAFYAARIRRIFPSLITVLAATLTAGFALLPTELLNQLAKHITAGASFLSNFLLWHESGYFDHASETKPLLHLWSLGVEEQFYLLWPLLLWLTTKIPRGQTVGNKNRQDFKLSSRTILILIIALLSFITNIFLSHNHTADFYSPFSRFWELMLGAVLTNLPSCLNKNSSHLLSTIGLALILTAIGAFTPHTVFPSWNALLPTFGAALLIAAGPETLINRLLSKPLFVAIGLISYPLYLWHWPILVFLHLHTGSNPPPILKTAALAAAFLLASLTYMLIEKPIRFGPRKNKIIFTLCCALAALGCTGLAIGLKTKPAPATTPQSQQTQTIKERYPLADCPYSTVPENLKRYCSVYGDPNAKKTVILWGDSHAGEWLEPWGWSATFYEIARERSETRVIRFSTPGCPPLLGVHRTGPMGSSENCHDITQGNAILTTMRSLHPDLIVMIARWSLYTTGIRYTNGGLQPDYLPITTAPGDTPMPENQDAMQKKLLPTIKAVSAIADTLILKNFPVLLSSVSFTPGSKYAIEPTLQQHLTLSEPSNHLLDEAANLSHVKLYDPTPVMCSKTCSGVINGVTMYRDDSHPSPEGALLFKPYIEEILKSF
jgi:peptidoglycan/LPS O-acetylase OafA/YrhL